MGSYRREAEWLGTISKWSYWERVNTTPVVYVILETLETRFSSQAVWERLQQCSDMLKISLSRSTWALCRWEQFSHQLTICPFLLHARLWVGFVISVGEKNCAENKNTFQGPALQASLGVSRNIERAKKGDSHVQKELKMCLEIWHALKIQHSHFFRRRSWTKRWQLRGSRWFKDS